MFLAVVVDFELFDAGQLLAAVVVVAGLQLLVFASEGGDAVAVGVVAVVGVAAEGEAVASGVVVVGDFGLALPVGDEAKEGFLFLWVSRNDPEMLVSMPLPVSVTVRF
ncbi:hypothetical protein [Microbulbifer thermotolerans]|uniref:Uncharacterized protein n=2 Tax=Microbulbifer thermotolerans TaxID=252514 RepID=A0A143HN60_MICTH|nr:hypothetical protein [Microbulbifer thermotolerans]AMX03139.1 hypothetical protein A3224_11645 [Microbulbifer thermotolerans]